MFEILERYLTWTNRYVILMDLMRAKGKSLLELVVHASYYEQHNKSDRMSGFFDKMQRVDNFREFEVFALKVKNSIKNEELKKFL